MNERELDSLLAHSPRLFHMAERGAWDGIRRNGLLSTSALLDLYDVRGKAKFALESERRDKIVSLPAHGPPEAKLRDQCAMNERILMGCLEDMTLRQWYECLNAKVFFWLTQERLCKFSNAQPYRCGEREVLALDSRSLVTAYRDKISLCRMNSGATKRNQRPRGRTTFLRIDDYPYVRRRAKEKRVVELCVDYGIKDVERFVQCVYVVKGTKVIRKLA